jgi:hypothetical protein
MSDGKRATLTRMEIRRRDIPSAYLADEDLATVEFVGHSPAAYLAFHAG